MVRCLALVVVVAALGGACPGSTAGAGEGEGEGEGTTPQDVVDAINGYFVRCGTQAFGFTGASEPTLTNALIGEVTESQGPVLLHELNDPNVTYHADQAAQCVTALATAACVAIVDGVEPAPECEGLTTGNLADGVACSFNGECAAGACFSAQPNTCGTCTAFAQSGEDCTAAFCGAGLTCDDATKLCVDAPPPFADGDPCDDSDPRNCNNDALACLNNVCNTIVIVQPGDPCDLDRHCIDSASKNVCLPSGGTSTCTARPGLAGDCSAVPLCDDTVAVCKAGVCVDDGDKGATCSISGDCRVGLHCGSDSTCADAFTIAAAPTCN